jgi:urocanate hydratase
MVVQSQRERDVADILFRELPIGIPIDQLPEKEEVLLSRDPRVPHAPKRILNLSKEEQHLAVRNALRYFPEKYHKVLAGEFVKELHEYGHIYMYRFRPTTYEMKAYPIDYYPAKSHHGRDIVV